MRVVCNSSRVFLKILCVCKQLHKKFTRSARVFISVIAKSTCKLHHTSILGQRKRICSLCVCQQFNDGMAKANTKTLLPLFQSYCIYTDITQLIAYTMCCFVFMQTYREFSRMSASSGIRVHVLTKAKATANSFGPQSSQRFGNSKMFFSVII